MAAEPTPAELAAKDAIRDLVLLYSRAIDRKDCDLARSLYAEDATDTHGDLHFATVDAFVAALHEELPHQWNGGHYVTNHLITVAGDLAEGEVYAIACHVVDEGGWHEHVMRVRYLDKYRRENGRWLFASRVVVFDHVSTRPARAPGDAGDADSDLSYSTLTARAFSRGFRE